jgi:hypothetical protein
VREPLFDEDGKVKNREDLLSITTAVGKVRVTKLSDVAERRVYDNGKSEVHVTLPPVDINSPS